MDNSVTVVIPTYNRPKLVIRAINSVINQDFQGKVFCIIVDNSTNLDTENNIKKIDLDKNSNREIVYIKNNDSSFPIDNWILGTEKIETAYAKFLCDDDWLENNFISTLLNKMEETKAGTGIANIKLHKETKKEIKQVDKYYNYKIGLVSPSSVIDSYLKLSDILPATPTASLMLTEKLKESFFFALEHYECTKQLFGFDFLMNYYCSFDKSGTFMTNESLANSWAGKDSMTLNIKISLLSYCNFFALLRLIRKFQIKLEKKQLEQIQNTLFVIRLKSIFKKEYKKILLDVPFESKANFYKIIKNLIKRVLIKIKYKFI
tara:strand:+ start:230 stop:1186 length:957 start_codon:yes stop_codon:yes gene_type:complete